MTLTIKQLRYFVATAEFGQISQAAVELSISQSTITSAIKELEQTVGTELFRRVPNGMELTDTGRRFLAHAHDILVRVNDALSLPAGQDDTSGTLAVAATYTAIGYFMPYHLERFGRIFRDLKIQIYEMSREVIEEGLLSNRYDIAVLLTSNLSNPALGSETLLSSQRRLWVSARHPLTAANEVSLEQIAAEPYIMLTADEGAYTTLRYWGRTPYQPKPILRTSSIEAVRSMVANGQGVTILSDMLYQPWSREGKRIKTVPVSDPVPAMDVGLAWNKTAGFTAAMSAFRGYFRQATQPAHMRA